MPRLLLVLALTTTAPAFAQSPDESSELPVFFSSGTFGVGYLGGARGNNMVGLDFSLDLHHRRHAAGVRVRTHTPFLFGSPAQVTEVGGAYTFSLTRSVSVGAGMFYINQIYRPDDTFDYLQSKRLGVPLELTLRIRPLPDWSPYVRGVVTLSEDPAHGGLSFGISF